MELSWKTLHELFGAGLDFFTRLLAMALIPASVQITSISIFQLVVAYFLLTNPEKLSTYNLTTLLSLCFDLPYKPPSFSQPSAMSSLLAAALAYISFSDLVSTNMHEEVYSIYWSAQAPIRALFFFVLSVGSLLSTPLGVGKISKVLAGAPGTLTPSGPGKLEGGLSNGVVFVWGFIMVMWWFWTYVTIRDERREMLTKKQAKRT